MEPWRLAGAFECDQDLLSHTHNTSKWLPVYAIWQARSSHWLGSVASALTQVAQRQLEEPAGGVIFSQLPVMLQKLSLVQQDALRGKRKLFGGEELTSEGIRYYRSLEGEKDLTFDKLPILVRFHDIKDSKTVEFVDPNDLEKTFGNGVKLVSSRWK